MRRLSESPLTVLKFGSSVLRDEQDLPLAVHEIYRYVRSGHRVVAVVSALGRATDRLLGQARQYGDEPAAPPLAALLATGEATAAALLALALDRAGVPATLFDPHQAGLRTGGPRLDAIPCGLDVDRVARRLARRPVAVLPGFVGQGGDGGPTLLGRGGTDLTALYVAHRLGAAACRLVKDVDGVYDRDPAAGQGAAAIAATARPRRYRSISWSDAAALQGRVVQGKALTFAVRHRVPFTVAAAGSDAGTQIGPWPTRLDPVAGCALDLGAERGSGSAVAAPAPRPALVVAPGAGGGVLRVVLLGHGTVGGGVYRHLAAQPGLFQVVGVAVRDVERHARLGVPPELLSADPWSALQRPCDLVIELIGGDDPAARLIAAALGRGLDVVTANKQVIAGEGEWLRRHAAAHGARLLYSAAVGGAVPVIEAVARVRARGSIRAVSGVLNGTCNFVLERLAAGEPLADAVRAAQQKGFAEADPSRDLDGRDAAAKLRVLAPHAFGVELGAGQLRYSGLETVDAAAIAAASGAGRVIRLVASCRWGGGAGRRRMLHAWVRAMALPVRHFLAGARGEENRVLIERRGAPPLRLGGRGAGRWATSEAVLGDVMQIARERRSQGVAPARPGAAGERAGAASEVAP